MAKLVAKTYGDALFELALEKNQIDTFQEAVEVLDAVLRDNEDLMKLMNHPKVIKEEKIRIIEETFKGRILDDLTGFLRIIITKDRFSDINEILEYFIGRVKEYKNIGIAYVTSAKALSDSQKAQVEAKLLATTKYESFEMHFKEDASLIGGMVIRIGDRVVDSSIKTKINELTRDLMKIQLAN